MEDSCNRVVSLKQHLQPHTNSVTREKKINHFSLALQITFEMVLLLFESCFLKEPSSRKHTNHPSNLTNTKNSTQNQGVSSY